MVEKDQKFDAFPNKEFSLFFLFEFYFIFIDISWVQPEQIRNDQEIFEFYYQQVFFYIVGVATKTWFAKLNLKNKIEMSF